MANAFSIPQSFGQYIQPVNLNLVNASLASKQQRYDYNVAKVDSLLSEFSSIELIRDEDKQYLADRVNGVLNTVNQVQKKDMASNNLTREITQYIGTAIDDRVLEQAANTTKIKTFEQSVAERREKKPETYSDINFTYAQKRAGLDKYLSGETDTIGSLQYSEYKDVNKRVNDFILDLQAKKKDEIVEIPMTAPDGSHYIQKTTTSGLSPEQLRAYASSQLDASYMQQIKINGWYNAGGYENSELIGQGIDELVKYKGAQFEADKLKLERLKSETSSDSDKKIIQDKIDALTNSNAELAKNLTTLKSNPEQAATYIEQERLFSGVENTFKDFYSKSVSYSADESYYKQQNLLIDQAKLQLELAKTTGSGEAYTKTNISEYPGDDSYESYQKNVDDQLTSLGTQTDSIRNSYVNALRKEASNGNQDASNFIREYDIALANKEQSKTDESIFDDLLASTKYKSTLNILGDRNYRQEIMDAKNKEQILLDGYSNAVKLGLEQHIDATINSKEGLKAFYDNPDTKMLYNGKAVSVKSLLQSNGIIDSNGNKIGDLKSKPEILKELQKSFYADDILSNTGWSASETDAANSLNQLVSILGENPNDAYTKFTRKSSDIGFGDGKTWYQIKPGSKTAAYINQAKTNGIYDTFSWNDQSLSSDDATIAKFVKDDYKNTQMYKSEIAKFANNLPSSYSLGIPSTDKANFDRLLGRMSMDNADVTKTGTITVSKRGTDIVLTQQHSEGSGDKKITAPIDVVLTQEEFNQNFPALSSKIDFNREASFYTVDKMQGKVLKSEAVEFVGQDDYKTYSYVLNKVLKNENSRKIYGAFIDLDSAKAVWSSNNTLVGKYGSDVFTDLLNKAATKSNLFSIQMKVDRDFSGEPILDTYLVNKNTGEKIYNRVIRGNEDITNFKEIFDSAPQTFYGIMVNEMLQKDSALSISGSQDVFTPLQKFNNALDGTQTN